ncbi:glycosyltransferase [Bacteroides caecigallinarum]|uniref:glycosyltransferase family 4 protein n=1 Tax=Bacteroides caecigallinarum TaxID=1411144 RepID=UPI0019588A3F|nr:glycosyltransferase [Bacteroides caecigallinarum]MBM6961652.1 glycosyltransferase [Bacteroides caecigallinarum]
MNILFITNNFPPIVDGVGDYTYNIAKQFVEHKHNVYIVCKKTNEICTNEKEMTILPIIKKWDFTSHKPIVNLIRNKSIDIVSLQYVPHGYQQKGLPFPLIKLTYEIKQTQAKLFTFFHEVCIDYYGLNLKRTFFSLGIRTIAKRLIKNSDYVATSIEYYADRIRKFYKDINVFTVRIASNIPFKYYNEIYLKQLKNKIAPKGEFVILFFGKRNVEYHVEAIKELKREGYKIVILSLGNTSFLKQEYGISTYKTGMIDINEMSQYFQIADCFCLPENDDCGCSFKSGALAAGLQYGLPIITNNGFMTESSLIGDNNIIFVNARNIYDIKKSIKRLMQDKNYYQSIRINALSIGKTLNWESTFTKYMDILK